MRWLVRIIHSRFSAGQTSLSLRFQCSPEEQVLLEMAWASDRLSAWGASSSARRPPFLLRPFWLLGLQPLFTERPSEADGATQDTDPEGPRPPPQGWSPRPAPRSATRPGVSEPLSQAWEKSLCSSGGPGWEAQLSWALTWFLGLPAFPFPASDSEQCACICRTSQHLLASPCPACSPAAFLLLSGVTPPQLPATAPQLNVREQVVWTACFPF